MIEYMALGTKVKVKYNLNLSYTSLCRLIFSFQWRVLIFCTMIGLRLTITTRVSDRPYDIGVKGQCQI